MSPPGLPRPGNPNDMIRTIASLLRLLPSPSARPQPSSHRRQLLPVAAAAARRRPFAPTARSPPQLCLLRSSTSSATSHAPPGSAPPPAARRHQHTAVADAYQALVASSELKQDEGQKKLAARLGELQRHVERLHAMRSSLGFDASAALWRASRMAGGASQGIYVHGGVGVGKSMMMDLLFDAAALPAEAKRRTHYHSFMLDVHRRIHELRVAAGPGVDPIRSVGRMMARSVAPRTRAPEDAPSPPPPPPTPRDRQTSATHDWTTLPPGRRVRRSRARVRRPELSVPKANPDVALLGS